MITMDELIRREAAYVDGVTGKMVLAYWLGHGMIERQITGYHNYHEYMKMREDIRRQVLDEINRDKEPHDDWDAYDQSDIGEGEQPSLTPLFDKAGSTQ